jgi:hypothetical protein
MIASDWLCLAICCKQLVPVLEDLAKGGILCQTDISRLREVEKQARRARGAMRIFSGGEWSGPLGELGEMLAIFPVVNRAMGLLTEDEGKRLLASHPTAAEVAEAVARIPSDAHYGKLIATFAAVIGGNWASGNLECLCEFCGKLGELCSQKDTELRGHAEASSLELALGA